VPLAAPHPSPLPASGEREGPTPKAGEGEGRQPYRRLVGALVLSLVVAVSANAQRLLIGSWQTKLGPSAVTLTIITADGDGWVHGIVHYDPPQADGFAGSPFTTRIENGAFSIRLVNATRYADMHWCSDELCGTFYAPDDTATPVDFTRPQN
jgi:hypothetical protein